MKVNNEAKARRSADRGVLGNAKVMGADEIEAARAKRAEKEAIEEAKGKAKRSRKKKASSGAAEKEGQQAATTPKVKRGRKRKNTTAPESSIVATVGQSEAQVEDIRGRQEGEHNHTQQWSAPVAPMLHTVIP